MSLPEGEESVRLETFVQDLARSFNDMEVGAVAVLRAEGHAPGRPVNVTGIERRAIIETLVRLAGVRAGVVVELMDRATTRSRLGLDRRGPLEQMLSTAAPGMHGMYWAQGRGLAAVAAMASTSV